MTIQLGVIADDFTGATDIAGFLVANGLRTIQLAGVPSTPLADDVAAEVDAVVISLKSRSIPSAEAVDLSVNALRWLQAQGTERFLFKYCSTFDSTAEGNIGPVTDALMAALSTDITLICPALPVNGRSIYQGYLFVGNVLLNESGMRNHPVTPMRDASLMRVMDSQSQGKTGNIAWPTITQGTTAVRAALEDLRDEGIKYVVMDALDDADLDTIGEIAATMPLVTGGSGLGAGLARALAKGRPARSADAWTPVPGRRIILSGSCSVMTNAQVATYRAQAPSFPVVVDDLIANPEGYRTQVREWILAQPASPAPMVYATSEPSEVARLQAKFGAAESAEAIENFFGTLATELAAAGFAGFIVAGGETSGAVSTALKVDGFEVGPQIAPGVPWVRSLDNTVQLALKSGNFGDTDFFARAQQISN